MDSGLKDLLSLFFERSNALQTSWSVYITIILGLLAFFGSKKRTKSIAAFLSIGFVMFAIVNLDALRDISRERLVLDAAISSLAKQAQAPLASEISRALNPSSVRDVVFVHVTGDLLALAGMWFLVLREQEPEPRPVG